MVDRVREHASGDMGGGDGMPHSESAAALLQSAKAPNSMSELKEELMGLHRLGTTQNLLGPRVVRYHQSHQLLDLAPVAHMGITSRVASRVSVHSDSGGVRSAASYWRLAKMAYAVASPGQRGKRRSADDHDLGHGDDEYVEHGVGLTTALVRTVGVALLSAVQFGYNNGNMNTQAGVQRLALGIPVGAGAAADNLWATCVSVACLGALVGCNLSGALSDRWGRRSYLLASAGIYMAGAMLSTASCLPPPSHFPRQWAAAPGGADPAEAAAAGYAPCWARVVLLLLGRVLSGVACGGTTVVVPMYLGEVSPAHLRGTLGTAFQLTFVSAMLVAQLLGLPILLGRPALWPLVFLVVCLPSVLQLALASLLVESPRWHCQHGDVDTATATLAHLRATEEDDPCVIDELDAMLEALAPTNNKRVSREDSEEAVGLGKLCIRPTRWPLFICITVMALQQLSGINTAFNYSTTFLVANGLSESTVVAIAIFMNVGNVTVTALSVYLMDRAGRRRLLLSSMTGMALAAILLTWALATPSKPWTGPVVVVAVVLFTALFGIGLGPVAWLLPAEIMPPQTRALGSSVAASVNWLANFFVGQIFLLVAGLLGSHAFAPFVAVLALGVVFVALTVPETKGKSLEHIQRELQGDR